MQSLIRKGLAANEELLAASIEATPCVSPIPTAARVLPSRTNFSAPRLSKPRPTSGPCASYHWPARPT